MIASDGLIEDCQEKFVKSEEGLESGGMLIDEREGVVIRDMRDESVDDGWEGIERSELEKVFAEAVNYVGHGGKDKEDDPLSKLGSDVQMQLYGLHKVAVEGPCHDPQPMALMVSARGKWNAWQRLGSMNREAAMEHYVQLLSQNIPEWMHQYSADDGVQRKTETKDEIPVDERDGKPEPGTSQSSSDKVGV